MSLKGLAYLKTIWSFQERPVASGKLNTWDDRIEAAVALACQWMNESWGGGSGVVRGAAGAGLQVTALATPGLSVEVQPGRAFISQNLFQLDAVTASAAVTPPVTFPRIDLVQASLDTWAITLKGGTEASSPIPPVPDLDCVALAELHLRPAMWSIKESDDSINGYIVDTRVFV